MFIMFNDGTEQNIQSHKIKNGALCFILETKNTENFQDEEKTKVITVKERQDILAVYERYTNFYGVTDLKGGLYEVILFQVGKSSEERLNTAESKIEGQGTDIEVCYEAIAELSELIVG